MNNDIKTIIDMFSYKRPAGGKTEQAFVDKFLTPLGFKRDEFENLVLKVGKSNILFSSHVDTVHKTDGLQKPKWDGTMLTQKGSNCLGADCTAGVWLMTEMIKAKIPGVYVIHHGEERGCIGSGALADLNPAFFADIDIAIAFDRAGYNDIITHQSGRRTASDAFAKSLGAQLDQYYAPSDEGAYTDTNEYRKLVAECTNISVGYRHQHFQDEQQDVPFLIYLRDRLLKVEWDKLVVERDLATAADDEWDDSYFFRPKAKKQTFIDLITEFPEIVEDILHGCGIGIDDLLDEIEGSYGIRFAA